MQLESPSGDGNALATCGHKPPDVVWIGRQNLGVSSNRKLYHGGIDDVGCLCSSEQSAHAMGTGLVKTHNLATPKKATKLRLLRRPAHLRYDVGWGERNDTR